MEDGTIKRGSVLLVENYDRISRLPPVESLSLFLSLINAGIGIVFTASYEKRVITSELLNRESYALQMVLGECIRAHEESRRKSDMVKKAKQTKREEILKGEVVTHNNVPKYFTFDKEAKKYIHNENTKIVTEIVDDYLAGNSLYSIATKLNEKKTAPFRYGSQWSACTVRSILRNKALIGEFMGNPKFLPPIVIDPNDFKKVQVQLNRNKGFAGQTGELMNIFRGVCFCTCGKAMSVLSNSKDYRTKKKWKTPYRYLRCSTVGTGKQTCTHKKVIKLEPIEDEFFGVFLLQDPRQMLGNTDNAELKRLKAQSTEHQTNIDRISQSIAKLIDLMATTDVPEVPEKLKKLEAERKQEKAAIDELNLGISAVTAAPTDFKDIRKLFKNIVSNTKAYDDAVRSIKEDLKDNELRKKLRVLLPSQIGKIVVDTEKGTWVVYNRSGAELYTGPFDHPSTYIKSEAA